MLYIRSKKNESQNICVNCIMDTSAPEITFDEKGVCNFCHEYADSFMERDYDFLSAIQRIKANGKGKRYDCIIGLSGGLDSSFAFHNIIRAGLRPLVVVVDNGYDNTQNVYKMILKANCKQIFYRIPEGFKKMQKAFLRASLPNIEIPTDHIITSYLFQVAEEYKIKYIINGSNIITECIMPKSWGFDARDYRHYRTVCKKFGKVDPKDFPHMTLWDWFRVLFIKKIKFFPILNYISYNIKEAKKLLIKEYNWEDYGDKHEESDFTKWFQSYYLPIKFNINKKKAHYSCLINSGQMTREEALSKLKDIEFNQYSVEIKNLTKIIIDRLGITDIEFEQIMALPKRRHESLPNNQFWFKSFAKIARRVAING